MKNSNRGEESGQARTASAPSLEVDEGGVEMCWAWRTCWRPRVVIRRREEIIENREGSCDRVCGRESAGILEEEAEERA